MKMFRQLGVVSAVGAFVLALAGVANAGEITFTGNYGNLTGTGNGPVLGVLSLQQDGGDDFEWGTTGWNGTHETWNGFDDANDIPNDHSIRGTNLSASGYYARSVDELADNGIDDSNLALVFQTNVAGQNDTVTIHNFQIVFYNVDGSEAFFLTYEPDGHSTDGTDIDDQLDGTDPDGEHDDGILPGVGQGSSGWLYVIDQSQFDSATQDAWDDFWAAGTGYIGIRVYQFSDTLSDDDGDEVNFQPTNDGADNFFFTTADAPPLVPLPPAAFLGLGMMGGLGVLRMRKRRKLAEI